MTTEDDFRRAIDTNPDDWQSLAVFSDWLRERGDERADGYAVLAALRKCPRTETYTDYTPENQPVVCFQWGKVGTATFAERHDAANNRDPDALAPDWYDAVRAFNQYPEVDSFAWTYFRTPADAFDAAAVAFSELPAERRAELLTTGDKS